MLDVQPRRGRSAEDISASLSITQTVQNRLTSLCGHLAKVLLGRLEYNPNPIIITTMGKCLDLDNILVVGDSPEVNEERNKKMRKVCRAAKIEGDSIDKILTKYCTFKDRLKAVVQCSEEDELVRRFEIHLFQTHNCSNECDKNCPDKDKVIMPRLPILLKIVNLFYKEPSL